MAGFSKPAPDPPAVPSVILITDGRRLAPGAQPRQRVERLVAQARSAFAAGVDAVQIREPDLDDERLFALARAIAVEGRTIVTSRADVAIAARASGVHLRGDGPPSARVRALLADTMTLSRAVHAREEALREVREGAADWLVAGTAFETDAKPGREPLGEAGIRRLTSAVAVPIVAVGGITPATVRVARAAGAAGVAAIGAFLREIDREYVDSLRARY